MPFRLGFAKEPHGVFVMPRRRVPWRGGPHDDRVVAISLLPQVPWLTLVCQTPLARLPQT